MHAPTVLGEPSITERFSAMGTRAEVVLVGGDPHLIGAIARRVAQLESLWSRFQPDSDISRLNRNGGSAIRVEPETITLLERSLAAARATEGRFDPTVASALIAHGYDRTFTAVGEHAAGLQPSPVVDGSWPAIEVDRGAGTAALPPGTQFDPGGIGKGLAVDLIAAEFAHRATGLLVNLGGDLRATGAAPHPAGWVIAIEDPADHTITRGRLAIAEGAVATSSQMRRRWSTADGPAHHIIDPATGRPADSDVATATVVAAEAWWAEAHATALLLEGRSGLDRLDESTHAALVLTDGTVRTSPALEGMLR